MVVLRKTYNDCFVHTSDIIYFLYLISVKLYARYYHLLFHRLRLREVMNVSKFLASVMGQIMSSQNSYVEALNLCVLECDFIWW